MGAENPGQEDAELVFVGWADESTMPPQHSQPEPQHRASEIDREIERLYSELEEEGFSREQVSAMVKGETPIPSSEPVAVEPVGTMLSAPQEAPDDKQTPMVESVRPMDLLELFAKRRR